MAYSQIRIRYKAENKWHQLRIEWVTSKIYFELYFLFEFDSKLFLN